MAATALVDGGMSVTAHMHDAPSSAVTPSRGLRYRGHRTVSFVLHDIDELTELRAQMRTFDGAYLRTSMAILTYALLIVKLFAREFATIGLLHVGLALVFIFVGIMRRRRMAQDMSDDFQPAASHRQSFSERPETPEGLPSGRPPAQPADERIWATRPFITAGRIVIGLTLAVSAVEIAILSLILRLDGS